MPSPMPLHKEEWVVEEGALGRSWLCKKEERGEEKEEEREDESD